MARTRRQPFTLDDLSVAAWEAHPNAFAHGDPEAIDDAIVGAVVENLKSEHESWIAVFNRRLVRV